MAVINSRLEPLIDIGEVCTHAYYNKFRDEAFPAFNTAYKLIPTINPVTEDPKRYLGDTPLSDETQKYEVVKLPINPKGGIDVNVQDQTSPIIIAKANNVIAITTTAANNSIGDFTVTLTDATGFVEGGYIIITDTVENRFYVGKVLAVNANVITIDTPLDFAFPLGSSISVGSTNLAVDGSLTPQSFTIRSESNPTPISYDITRLIFSCTTDDPVDLSKFGDIVGGITKGLVARKIDGETRNIFNVKTNKEFAALMFDFDIFSATNPAQGQNGFLGRLTFAGQSKIGVAIRLEQGENLEFIVQDDLSQITLLEITTEGHVVE